MYDEYEEYEDDVTEAVDPVDHHLGRVQDLLLLEAKEELIAQLMEWRNELRKDPENDPVYLDGVDDAVLTLQQKLLGTGPVPPVTAAPPVTPTSEAYVPSGSMYEPMPPGRDLWAQAFGM